VERLSNMHSLIFVAYLIYVGKRVSEKEEEIRGGLKYKWAHRVSKTA
jgi:hypothetical protein